MTPSEAAKPAVLSSVTTAVADEIVIRGHRIPVKICQLANKRLKFFPENPRIFSIIGAGEKIPSQEEIEQRLLAMEHVKVLIQDIKRNGGLIDPVLVKDGSLEVLEGNSRLAAYRALSESDPIKWGLIKCVLLPSDLSDDMIFSLLGQYHVKGKKDWAPFEQAGFLYRRHKNQGIDITALSKEIGIGRGTVKQLVPPPVSAEVRPVAELALFRSHAAAARHAARMGGVGMHVRLTDVGIQLAPAWLGRAMELLQGRGPNAIEDVVRSDHALPASRQIAETLAVALVDGRYNASRMAEAMRTGRAPVPEPPIGQVASTIHAAKGREALDVELHLPEPRDGLLDAEAAEEARVLYVGATRARRHLYVAPQGATAHRRLSGRASLAWRRCKRDLRCARERGGNRAARQQ